MGVKTLVFVKFLEICFPSPRRVGLDLPWVWGAVAASSCRIVVTSA